MQQLKTAMPLENVERYCYLLFAEKIYLGALISKGTCCKTERAQQHVC